MPIDPRDETGFTCALCGGPMQLITQTRIGTVTAVAVCERCGHQFEEVVHVQPKHTALMESDSG